MTIQFISDSKGNTTGVYIPIEDWEKLKPFLKNAKIEGKGINKAEIFKNLKEAFQEVQLHQEGKIKLKPAKELLDEL